MKLFIGTKVLKAKPMSRGEYNALRGWAIPADENPDDAGYLTDNGAGRLQWQPKDVFEDAFSPFDGMDFSMALAALKMGKKVARAGWNGKAMWLALSGGVVGRMVASDNFWAQANQDFADSMGGRAHVLPCITMKTADNKILMGWLASQTDMLCNDWVIVE